MIFSLPNYRRLSEEDLARLNKDDPRSPSRRLQKAVLNILLLAGLWGLPFYGRSAVLSAMNEKMLREEILGKWLTSGGGLLEFTPNRRVRLSYGKRVVESAYYSFVGGDIVEIDGFRQQPEDRYLVVEPQWYQIPIQGGQLLTVTPSTYGFRPSLNAAVERSSLCRVLPTSHGDSRQFRREPEH
jgi:hypothetical protein